MFPGNLGGLQQPEVPLVLDQSPALHVSPGLVRHLHHELPVVVYHHVQDVQVHGGAEVVDVGDEAVLLALLNKLVKQPTVGE